ncbi:hypothetical protein [Microlunatus speluncae]|uniref:hypothetical protein n=1 Tax=Microlunatus speluncae TaxID=2594267 RepID=UPI00126670D4|nr:hypothetical protein [Microlunatus speluncae]
MLEFGTPATDAPDRGEYQLRLCRCSWRIEFGDELGAGEEDSDDRIDAAVGSLDGRALTAVIFEQPSLSTTFTFGDARLITFEIYTDPQVDGTEQWILLRPDNQVLAVGPGKNWRLSPADQT